MNEMCLKRNGVGLVWNGHSPKLALTPICPRETVFHNCDVIKDKRCRRILDIQNHTNCSRSSIPGCDAFSEKQLFELILMEKLRQKETLRITSFEPSPFDCQIRNHSSQTPTSPPKKKKNSLFSAHTFISLRSHPPKKNKKHRPIIPETTHGPRVSIIPTPPGSTRRILLGHGLQLSLHGQQLRLLPRFKSENESPKDDGGGIFLGKNRGIPEINRCLKFAILDPKSVLQLI